LYQVSASAPAAQDYLDVIEEVNEEYHQNFHVMTEEEYYASEFYAVSPTSYQAYLDNIASMDLNELRAELTNSVIEDTSVTVQCENLTRSTAGSKSVYFNYSRNIMTLDYKYSGSKYDTSYTPLVTVTRVLDTAFFVMTSHTGSFKNSNTRYTVVANGYIYTPAGLVNDQTFTVNFDL